MSYLAKQQVCCLSAKEYFTCPATSLHFLFSSGECVSPLPVLKWSASVVLCSEATVVWKVYSWCVMNRQALKLRASRDDLYRTGSVSRARLQGQDSHQQSVLGGQEGRRQGSSQTRLASSCSTCPPSPPPLSFHKLSLPRVPNQAGSITPMLSTQSFHFYFHCYSM